MALTAYQWRPQCLGRDAACLTHLASFAFAILALVSLASAGAEAAPPPVEPGFEAKEITVALADLDAERYGLARERLQAAADRGQSTAMVILADMDYFGWGGERDVAAARARYLAASALDDAGGYFGLGRLHLFGHGVEKNLDEAIHWFTLAGRTGMVDLESELNDTMCIRKKTPERTERALRSFVKYVPLRPGTYLHVKALRTAFSCAW